MPQLVRVLINVITSLINSFPRRRHQRAVVTPHLNTGLWLSMESWSPGQRQTQTHVWWDVWQLTMIWRWSYFLTYLLFWTLNNVEYLFFLFGSFGTGSNISSLIWITIDWFDHTSAKINWMNFRNIWPSLQLCRRFGELDQGSCFIHHLGLFLFYSNNWCFDFIFWRMAKSETREAHHGCV